MKKLITTTALFSLILISACGYMGGVRGSGDITEEIRDIDEFTKLDVSGAYTVRVTLGEVPSLKITGDNNLLKYVITKTKGDRLIIESRKNLKPRSEIKILITTYSLNELDASGANNIKIRRIDTEYFDAEISGACSVELFGDTEKFNVSLSGASNLEAEELRAQHVKIECSGVSNADVYASKSIKAEVSGVSNIDFYGDPDDVKTNISGVSSIDRK